MLDKNLLLGCRSFKKTEGSKSVTDFLKVKCDKCKHEIKFKLALWDISNVEAYIEELRQENKALKKGINSLMQSRKKWKNRYYNMKRKNKQLESSNQKLIEINDKYLQKLVYALTPTTHELSTDNNNAFKKIIADNIDLETCKIRRKLKEFWGVDKY